jgi:hypothetical protein
MTAVTSADNTPQMFHASPGPTVDRNAAYEAVLQALVDVVGANCPPVPAGEPGASRGWRHQARRAAGSAVTRRARQASKSGPVPEEWFQPLIRAAVTEPDPSFNRQLVEPAMAAFGRRRVQLALVELTETGTTAEVAGAARAWYWTQVPLVYVGGSKTPTPESVAEWKSFSDLRQRYYHAALRRFVTDDDLDARRCILPGLPLDPQSYPADMQELVTTAVRIARTSNDEYLRHRVEIQVSH